MLEETTTPETATESAAPVEKRYFGTKKFVSHAETLDGKTVGLLFEDESSLNIPKWEFEQLVSETPTDNQTLRRMREIAVSQQVLQLLLDVDYPATQGAVEGLLQQVANSLFQREIGGSVPKAMDKMVSLASSGVINSVGELRLGTVDSLLKGE